MIRNNHYSENVVIQLRNEGLDEAHLIPHLDWPRCCCCFLSLR